MKTTADTMPGHSHFTAASRRGGFTLIEVVIALGMLVMVLVMSYQIFSNCIDTEKKIIEITIPEKVGEGILTLMRRDLAGTVFKGCTEQFDNLVFVGEDGGVEDEEKDSVYFVSTVDPTPGENFMEWDNLRTLTVVSYRLAPNQLSRKYPTHTLYRKEMIDFARRDITNAPGLNYSIYDKVKSLRIEYFDGESWSDEWDSRANIEAELSRQEEENSLAGSRSNIPRVTGDVPAEEEGIPGEQEPQAAAIPVAVRIELQIYSGSGSRILEKGGDPVVNRFTTLVPLLASRRLPIPIEDEDLASQGNADGAGGSGAAGADGAVNTFGADLTKQQGRGQRGGKGSLRDRLTQRAGRGASGRGEGRGGRNPAPGVGDRALNAIKGRLPAGATSGFGKGGPR